MSGIHRIPLPYGHLSITISQVLSFDAACTIKSVANATSAYVAAICLFRPFSQPSRSCPPHKCEDALPFSTPMLISYNTPQHAATQADLLSWQSCRLAIPSHADALCAGQNFFFSTPSVSPLSIPERSHLRAQHPSPSVPSRITKYDLTAAPFRHLRRNDLGVPYFPPLHDPIGLSNKLLSICSFSWTKESS